MGEFADGEMADGATTRRRGGLWFHRECDDRRRVVPGSKAHDPGTTHRRTV